MRGDRPFPVEEMAQQGLFTPHARGSTGKLTPVLPRLFVYPACAGIDPSSRPSWASAKCLPRMRGDRPSMVIASVRFSSFTPHARGSTATAIGPSLRSSVYPACAGIDLARCTERGISRSLPRMRGDRPTCVVLDAKGNTFTPHARGSTQILHSIRQ